MLGERERRLRKPRERILVVDGLLPRLGRIEHVLLELGAELRELSRHVLEPRLLLLGQVDTGEAEIAKRVLDELSLRLGERGESRAFGDRAVGAIERFVLTHLGVVLAEQRERRVVDLAQRLVVGHRVQV